MGYVYLGEGTEETPEEKPKGRFVFLGDETEEPQVAPEEGGDFMRGLKRGTQQMQAMGYGAAGLVGSGLEKATGIGEGLRDWGYEGFLRNMEEAEQYPGTRLKDIDGVGSFVDWAQGTAGELLPSMGEAAITAGIGAALGSGAAPGAGTAAGAGAGLFGKAAVRKAVAGLAKANMKKDMTREAAEKLALKQLDDGLLKSVARTMGGKAGVVAGVAPVEAGGNWGEGMQEGFDNPVTALATGTAAAFLELAGGNIKLVDGVLGREASAMLGKAIQKGDASLAGRIVRQAAMQAPQEFAQESGQELLSLANVAVNDPTFEMFTSENLYRLAESGAAGALAGAGGGAFQGAIAPAPKSMPDVEPTTPEVSPDRTAFIDKVRADLVDPTSPLSLEDVIDMRTDERVQRLGLVDELNKIIVEKHGEKIYKPEALHTPKKEYEEPAPVIDVPQQEQPDPIAAAAQQVQQPEGIEVPLAGAKITPEELAARQAMIQPEPEPSRIIQQPSATISPEEYEQRRQMIAEAQKSQGSSFDPAQYDMLAGGQTPQTQLPEAAMPDLQGDREQITMSPEEWETARTALANQAKNAPLALPSSDTIYLPEIPPDVTTQGAGVETPPASKPPLGEQPKADATPSPEGAGVSSGQIPEQKQEQVAAKPAPAAEEEATKPETKNGHGWVWIDGKQRPFREWREIKRGKNKGRVVVQVAGKGKLVDKEKVQRWPESINHQLDKSASKVEAQSTTSSQSVPPSNTAQTPGAKIDDFGEKIGGARKDYATLLRDAHSYDIATTPLSKSFPEPQYDKLVEAGADPHVAGIVHAIRDEVPSKPRDARRMRGYVKAVEELRGLADDILSGKIDRDTLNERLEGNSALGASIQGRADLYAAVGHDKSLKGVTFQKHHYSLYKGQEDVTKWTVEKKARATAFSSWPTVLAEGDTKEEALASFVSKWLTTKSSAGRKPVEFNVYQYRGGSGVVIGKKVGRNYLDVKGGFADFREAREYIKEHRDELEAELAKIKDTPQERRESNRERVGVDRREGNVTPEDFTKAFGFRGVEFGNWVENDRRQADLNRAYDALEDLADILDIPTQALSLNGELGLAFGARGHGGKGAPSAHYEPVKVAINLTKRSGAGSLAHEWFHALDNYFSRMRQQKGGFITERPRASQGETTVREEVLRAFHDLMLSLRQDTKIFDRSKVLDASRSNNYWSQVPEVGARAFENYVVSKMDAAEITNDYLANIKTHAEYGESVKTLSIDGKIYKSTDVYPYLMKDELSAVREKFDNLFSTLETRKTNKGIALFKKTDDQPYALALTVEEAQAVVDPIAKDWTGGPEIKVVQEISELPETLYRRALDAGGDVAGAFDGDTCFIVADGVFDAESAQKTVLHEVVGHWGMQKTFGKGFTRLMNNIYWSVGKERMAGIAKVYDLDLSNREDRIEAAEEYVAHLAEHPSENPKIWTKFTTWLKKWLSDHGFKVEFSDDEIKALIAKAGKGVTGEGKSGNITRMSLKEGPGKPTETNPDEPVGGTDAFLMKESLRYKTAESFADQYIIPKPEVSDKVISEIARAIDCGDKDYAVEILKKRGIKSIDCYHITALSPEGNASLKGIDRGGEWYGRDPSVYFFADPDDIALAIPFLALKIEGNQGGDVAVVHFQVPAEDVASFEWDGFFNSQFETYSAFKIGKDVSPDQVEGSYRYHIPSAKEYNDIKRWRSKSREQLIKLWNESAASKQLSPAKGAGRLRLAGIDSLPESPTPVQVKSALRAETDAALSTILSKLRPKSMTLAERVLRSPEWYSHPTLRHITDIAVERENVRHATFNRINGPDDASVTKANMELKHKGLTKAQILRGRSSKEYRQLQRIIDEGDVKHIPPEKFEEMLKQRGVSKEVIDAWRLNREAYDRALDELMKPMLELQKQLAKRDPNRKYPTVLRIDGQDIDLRMVIAEMSKWKGSYAPRIREDGEWVVQGKKGKERVRYHKASEYQANRLKEKLTREGYEGLEVSKSSRIQDSTFNALDKAQMAKFLEAAFGDVKADDEKTAQAQAAMMESVIEQAADLIKARGFRAHAIHRKSGDVVKGYIEDPNERFVRYASRVSAGVAKSDAAAKMTDAFFGEYENGKRVGGVAADDPAYEVGLRYIEEQLRAADAADRAIGLAKSVATMKYLGFSPRAVAVNMTAMTTTVPPALQEYASGGKVGMRDVGRALKHAGVNYAHVMRGKDIEFDTPGLRKFILHAKSKNYAQAQYATEAMGTIRDAHGKAWANLMSGAMWGFAKSEEWMRGTTMLAAYEVAYKAGYRGKELERRAVDAANKAHGVYGRATLPSWAQGKGIGEKVGQMMYVYAKFPHNYMQMLYDLGMNKQNVKAFLWALSAPIVLGGAAGIPFKDSIFALVNAMMKLMGDDRDAEKLVWDGVREHMGEGGEKTLRYGALGAAGVDLSGSLSIGVGVPRNLWELTGAIGGVADDVRQTGRFLATGQPGKAAEKLLPTGIANIPRMIRELGGVTTGRGQRVWDADGKPYVPSAKESGLRLAGFRSVDQAALATRKWESKRQQKRFSDRRTKIYEELRAAVLSGNDKKLQRVWDDIYEYNEKAMAAEAPLITKTSIRRQLRAMNRPSRRERRLVSP